MIAPGTCRHCACTDGKHCQIYSGGEMCECSWANRERTLCTNPDCLMKESARMREARRSVCSCTGRGHHRDCKFARPLKPAKRRGWAA